MLPKPQLRTNPHYARGPPMKLYLLKRVKVRRLQVLSSLAR
jgi:hypothetical protein